MLLGHQAAVAGTATGGAPRMVAFEQVAPQTINYGPLFGDPLPSLVPAFSTGFSFIRHGGTANNFLKLNSGLGGVGSVFVGRSSGALLVQVRHSATHVRIYNRGSVVAADDTAYAIDVIWPGVLDGNITIGVNGSMATSGSTSAGTPPATAAVDQIGGMDTTAGGVTRYDEWARYFVSVAITEGQRATLRALIATALASGLPADSAAVAENVLSLDAGGSFWLANENTDLTVGITDLCGNRNAICTGLDYDNLAVIP